MVVEGCVALAGCCVRPSSEGAAATAAATAAAAAAALRERWAALLLAATAALPAEEVGVVLGAWAAMQEAAEQAPPSAGRLGLEASLEACHLPLLKVLLQRTEHP